MSYADVLVALGAVGVWPLDEAVGSTQLKDASGNGNHVSVPTGVTLRGATALVPGGPGSLLTASPAATWAPVTGISGLTPVSAWTIMALLTRTNTLKFDGIAKLITPTSGSIGYIGAYVRASNGGVRLDSNMGGTLRTFDSPGIVVPPDGSRQHVCLTYDGATITGYSNGISYGTQSATGTQTITNFEVIGTDNNGSLGHVAWWTRALTAVEVARTYRESLRGGVVSGGYG